MRKLTKKIFALLGSFALAAALVSCGDIATGDETQNLSETQGKARVIVNIERGLRSATLLPSDLTEDDITRVELSAKKVEDDPKRTVDPSEEFDVEHTWTSSESQTAISQMKAATDIIVDIATYDFELRLYKSSEKGDSILCESAKLTQTMHLGNNTLNFAAKYVSDENATGSLEVNFKFKKEDYVEHIGVEFYKAGDETSAQNENVYIYDKTNENDTFTVKYSMSGLEAGDYILKFYVYGLYPEARDADISDLINTYQKLVRIAPFCKTFAEIELDNLNSIYMVSFVLPDGVESYMGEWRRSRNKSRILPDEDYLLGSWPFHKFIGWYVNDKFEGEPVYYIEQGTKGDKTFYAKFEEDSLLVIDDISTLDTLGEQLAAANKAGLKSVTVKITDKISLDPLGENWMEDAIVYDDSSDKMEYKYASKAFAQITSVLEGFMKSSSTSDSEEYNGMKIELDLTETGISYLPTGAFIFTNLEPHGEREIGECLGCLTAVKLPDTVTAILPSALQLTGITSFKIPEKVIGIGSSAFELCQNLPNVTIPAGVTEIGRAAFSGCNSLEFVNFAEGSKCKTIGEGAFWGCENLKSITIPAGVTEISVAAFNDCESLEVVDFAEGSKCTSIGEDAFYECENLKSITIPAEITTIGERAFSWCRGLETVDFAEGSKCTTIGEYAFYGCSNLKSITIPAEVTTIGVSAFILCSGLETVNFAEESKCITIGEYAFDKCSNLKSITIPAGVTEIGDYAFRKCVNLTEINFAGTKEKWAKVEKGSNIFPASVKEIKCTDGETGYTYVEEDEGRG